MKSPYGRPARWGRSTRVAHRRRWVRVFYGFVGGETNQYYPALFEGTTAMEPAKDPEEGYHFTEDMTDKAINWCDSKRP